MNKAKDNFEIVKNLTIEDIKFEKTIVTIDKDYNSFKIIIGGSESIANFRFNFHGCDVYIYAQKSEDEYYNNSAIDFKNIESTKKRLFHILKNKYRTRRVVKDKKILYPFEFVDKIDRRIS